MAQLKAERRSFIQPFRSANLGPKKDKIQKKNLQVSPFYFACQ